MSNLKANNLPSERSLVVGLIVLTLLLASLPYALGYFITPPGTRFIGTAYNIDDYCNYLSWLRQTMDGRFFLHNQFTTESQHDLEFNIFFWILGRFASLVHFSPQAALQTARVGGGLALLLLIYRFYRAVLPHQPRARLTAFGFVCLSGGFGWATWPHWHDKNLPGSPVDAWQPEAFTFLTLYTSALMTVSTALIVAALYALLRGEQTGHWKYPVCAGICGAILGNMHSYDVLHLAAAWGLFLVVSTVLRRGRGVAGSWKRGILALALTLPTTAYQYYVFQREAVFQARANTPTPSPVFWHYVLGYGLVFLLALFLFVVSVKNLRGGLPLNDPARLNGLRDRIIVGCWAVGGLAVIYLPVPFQRKMIMGTHIPLCLLAGLGAAHLLSKTALTPRLQSSALAALVLLAMPTSLLFVCRDVSHLVADRSETQQQPFLSATLIDCFDWLRANTPRDSAVVGSPEKCAALPGYAGRTVWAGHWAETPAYGSKIAKFIHFADTQTPAAERLAFLASTNAQYFFYPKDIGSATLRDRYGRLHSFAPLATEPIPGTIRVYENRDYVIFRLPSP